jgi:hypothetical protein
MFQSRVKCQAHLVAKATQGLISIGSSQNVNRSKVTEGKTFTALEFCEASVVKGWTKICPSSNINS